MTTAYGIDNCLPCGLCTIGGIDILVWVGVACHRNN